MSYLAAQIAALEEISKAAEDAVEFKPHPAWPEVIEAARLLGVICGIAADRLKLRVAAMEARVIPRICPRCVEVLPPGVLKCPICQIPVAE